MKIIKARQFILRPYRREDLEHLVELLNNRCVTCNLSRVPYPYTISDGRKWINKCLKEQKSGPLREITFVIEVKGSLAGAIGLEIKGHAGTMGYWLGEPYWGRGIMTEAVRLVSDYGFKKLNLKRIQAYVFTNNPASARVLEKCGFKKEGTLRKHEKKEKKYRDDWLYAKIK